MNFVQRLKHTADLVEQTIQEGYGLDLRITGGQTLADRRVIFDLATPDNPLAHDIARAVGAGGCVIRFQIELLPPRG